MVCVWLSSCACVDAGRPRARANLAGGTPEAFAALIRGETERWSPVIKKLGLKTD